MTHISEICNLDKNIRKKTRKYPFKIIWFNVAIQIFIHIAAISGIYNVFYAQTPTIIFSILGK
jgi:uncharacterized membrane protein